MFTKYTSRLISLAATIAVFLSAIAASPIAASAATEGAGNKQVVTKAAAYASQAVLYGSTFSLYRWDGPAYVDVKGYCPEGVFVEYGAYLRGSNTYLNGTRRIWLDGARPRTEYNVLVVCLGANESYDVGRNYYLRFSGNTIRAYRK